MVGDDAVVADSCIIEMFCKMGFVVVLVVVDSNFSISSCIVISSMSSSFPKSLLMAKSNVGMEETACKSF